MFLFPSFLSIFKNTIDAIISTIIKPMTFNIYCHIEYLTLVEATIIIFEIKIKNILHKIVF